MFWNNKKKIAEQEKELEELKARLAEAEQKNAALTEEVNTLKGREAAVGRVMTDASFMAEGILSRAKEESDKVMEKAAQDADDVRIKSESLVTEAQEKGDKLVSEAQAKGQKLVEEAEEKSRQRLKETENEIRDYAAVLTKLNNNMKEQARLAEEASKRYAAFYEEMARALPGILGSAAMELPGAEKAADTAASPVRLSDIVPDSSDGKDITTDEILNKLT